MKNAQIAAALGTTEHMVKNYLRVIYDKVGVWNRVELALWYEKRRCEGCPVSSQPSAVSHQPEKLGRN